MLTYLLYEYTRNFLTFANTTAIAYHQNLAALGTFLPVCNSSCVRKHQKITTIPNLHTRVLTSLHSSSYCTVIGGKLPVLEGSFSLAYLRVVNVVAGGCRLYQEFTKLLVDNLRLGPFERTYSGQFLCILKPPSLKLYLRGMAARSCLR